MLNMHSFNAKALSYATNSDVQLELAKILCKNIESDLTNKTLLDLGAGSGNVYKVLKDKNFKNFIALDSASNLLALHPKAPNITFIHKSFDEFNYSSLDKDTFICSNAAMQWSANLDSLLFKLSKSKCELALSLFTSETFSKLHAHLNTTSPLRSKDEVTTLIKKHFGTFKILKSFSKRLQFKTQKELLSHLQDLGLLGGALDKTLSYKQAKRLLALPFLDLNYEALIFIR
ncbi:hypothetical protein BKH43_01215 [Helicobacter sp. 13S00401-1]|uniref:class I SAM-dependent methyltransferase n=1 Tax=Helicobacter sp. 13S00401-1 TaxID=1905758 RepID=UPI000BA66F3A|nr:class I SAM-dependent methyltransferase [Helicobacter sp. 13S00401-1]PAF51880.1 hypothetical protein BKH43_01215 [Helicobacter sp. 13S00401-1]